MRRRITEDQTRRLSGYADDYVTHSERRVLGDGHAALLAEDRRRDQQLRRRPFVLTEDDVSDVRPAVDEHRTDDVALEVLAGRQHLLEGRPRLPWRADQ